jgi:hypothetical protein
VAQAGEVARQVAGGRGADGIGVFGVVHRPDCETGRLRPPQ